MFSAFRQLPTLIDIAKDMEEICPDAVYLNHTNPVWIVAKVFEEVTDVDHYGFCHSVPGTARALADYLDVPYEELEYLAAGINHQAWFLELEREGEDLYPRLYEVMEDPDVYDRDEVKFELLRHFGAFVSETSMHNSDVVPYFRIHGQELRDELDLISRHYLDYKREDFESSGLPGVDEDDLDDATAERSGEYVVRFIHSRETGQPRSMNLVVRNDERLIENFPRHAAVDVPHLVDGSGVRPRSVGVIPEQLAALNRPLIAGHELIANALLERDPDAARMAVKLDPIASSVCTLEEIDQLVDELFAANEEYIPDFGDAALPSSRSAPTSDR